ncbi:GNAT family N-acetyltransferase [Devosia faecipullorum]|uniref:GNAT family N-acetyltransferase n=1 Tax=Devosia faecipullorum TaxID=2755039 RepID=UPI00187B363A|nr:GNAT family N-acetyltransferase [Devosia faecipullorum]
MTDLVIRPAGPDDIPLLVGLDTSVAKEPARAKAIEGWVVAGQCFCAGMGNDLLGYGVLHNHFFGQSMLELVMVGHAYRRRGIGRALIRHIIGRAGPVLWTSTNQSNLPMQALLAQMGFQRSGIIEGLDAGDPELIYRIGNAEV